MAPSGGKHELTRRRFIGAAAAAGATAAVPAASRAKAAAGRRPTAADVVVVGAGISGLSAARMLRERGKSVVVVEANHRVGGRTLNIGLPGGRGQVVEAGGEWAGPAQTQILALAKRVGIGTYATYNLGQNVLLYGGARTLYTGAIPAFPDADLLDFTAAQAKIEAIGRTIPLGAPHTAPHAANLDATTLKTWIDANTGTHGARVLFNLLANATMAAAPAHISLLWTAWFIASNQGINQMLATSGGAQQLRFNGGSQRISIQIARELGRSVLLDHPVSLIEHDRDRVVIHARDKPIRAKAVIVAVHPADTRRIEFAPSLPSARRALIKKWPTGSGWKVNVVYDKPFWRHGGLTGQVISDRSPCEVVYDNSPPSGSPGVLVSFVYTVGNKPAVLHNPRARRAAVLANLEEAFGPRAKHPTAYLETDWLDQPYISGCESPLGPGLLTHYGAAIRDPVGRIHWAATETSDRFSGYMDGAVRAGHHAATAALQHAS